MKGVPVQAGCHACLNCAVPMHGRLCGHEYPDGLPEGVKIELLVSRLSQHGQHMALQDHNDSLLCFICFNAATATHSSKSPSGDGDVATKSTATPLPLDVPIATDFNTSQPTSSDRESAGANTNVSDFGIAVPTVPSIAECDAEFRMQFYSNLDKRVRESQKNTKLFRPLFKTREEAMEIIKLLSEWDGISTGKRKRVHHSKQEYRYRDKYVLHHGSGTNALRHRETGVRVAIYEDMFEVMYDAHVGMGHARTARNILNELKNEWFGIIQADVQLVVDLCPNCVGNTSRIRTSQTPLKMLFSPTFGHRAQVDLVDMSFCETDDGYKWIVRYRDHHSGKCDVGATKSKTAQEIAPVVIRIMASTLVPNILQSDNGGEFLGETLKAVNR